MNVSSNIKFSELSGLLERISKLSKSTEKQELLRKFIRYWKEASEKSRNDSSSTSFDSFYPVLRLILPQLDKTRPSYGIKEWTLAKLYCDILCISKDSEESKTIFNFDKGSCDLAERMFNILLLRSGNSRLITIEEVNSRLDNIANASGSNRKDLLKENILYLHQNTNALDQKWLIRMILKRVNFGMTQKTIFKCCHPSSEDIYNVTTDLEAVCSNISFYDEAVQTIDIQISKPFKPMLSERGDIKNIIFQLENRPFIYETKFDGERVQLHKSGDIYRYWSRNGLEWTKSYGQTSEFGTLTPFICDQFRSSVKNCILDGEMMGYNNVTKTMGSKAEDFDIKHPNVERSSGYLPCFIAFDVLYLNDEVLTGKSVIDRKRILNCEILKAELEGKIQIAKYSQASTREECLAGFNAAIENCEEGIIVKRSDSNYCVNARKGGWFKIKPDYVLGLHEELDCVIVGGYFTGSKLIGHFLCAVRFHDEKEDVYKYFSFCKVGSGLTRKILNEYNMKMVNHWKAFRKDNPPSWLTLSPRSHEKPDIYIDPENSFIVQLKAAEIILSESYATKCTLRFPRIDCFREDKQPTEDCMTLKELNDLRCQHKGKLTSHILTIDSDDEDITPTLKPRTKRKSQLIQSIRSEVPNKQMIVESTKNLFFKGKEICLMISPQNDKFSEKNQLELLVYQNGGVIVQNPCQSTDLVITDRQTLKIQNLIKNSLYDIVTLDWLLQCLQENLFVVLKPCHYISMKPSTVQYFSNIYDKYGDSFTEPINCDELKIFFNLMNSKTEIPELKLSQKLSFLDEIQCEDLRSKFLSGYIIYFYVSSNGAEASVTQTSIIKRLKIGVKLAGGQVIDTLDTKIVTHVIMPNHYCIDDVKRLHLLNRDLQQKFYIVKCDWVVKTLDDFSKAPEKAYVIKIL